MQLFDLHCDSIVNYRNLKSDFFCKETQFSLQDLKKLKRYCQTMAIFIPDHLRGEEAFSYFCIHKAYLDSLLKQQASFAEWAQNGKDIEAITEQKKCAILLSVESGAALGGKLERVETLAEAGVKMMTLVWNGENEIGSGHETKKGLTPFGKKVISRMEETGIIVDVSHLNDVGFEEVCEVAKKPFIATHSNLRSVCGHKRNLTNHQFTEIVKRNGLVGLNLYEAFLADDGRGTMDALYSHVSAMLELGGEDVIACGSDFDGAAIDPSLNSPLKFASFADYLLQKGIKETVIDKIFFENALLFFRRNERD